MSTHLARLQNARDPHPVLTELMEHGRAIRRTVPRSAHAALELPADRDPLGVLAGQDATRLQHLVPLRHERMLQSPFAFYRGTAGIMAADLAPGARTGVEVVSCGDAHLSNFGLFASPQRSLVFDLNDFDESAPGPWEWDVKRLVTSAVIGGRDAGHSEEQVRRAAMASVTAYRMSLRSMMRLDALERYYSRVDTDAPHPHLDAQGQRVLDRAARQARRRTARAFVEKVMTTTEDGTPVLVENPPVLTHVTTRTEEELEELFEQYRSTVAPDIAVLVSHFTLTDLAMRVVGVGSVGTRCYILILAGPAGEPLVLQVKEAQASVLQSHGGIAPNPRAGGAHHSEGHRVVACQRILQAVSDPFLGHLQVDGRDYYVRQFRDMKGSIDTATLSPKAFRTYSAACGMVLARSHAQSRDAPVVAGYLGRSKEFDRAVVEWALAYADVSAADYELLRGAAS
ncbi:DUF2252 domain-containing protein [Herbiconiux moechotypicola]|uniref:DUF2252 domain-containing protein n=1 Tax=Herbiconiux moechotypicola TaxID=637393 RepID=A0ABN3DA89_9MICO|nr:DUF2252 domain-containing protein [Herbiconiux moechotypicola]MCS5728974.1 DUF2252 domain-containing protein [Herbiconiux moechotypicola]